MCCKTNKTVARPIANLASLLVTCTFVFLVGKLLGAFHISWAIVFAPFVTLLAIRIALVLALVVTVRNRRAKRRRG